MQFSDVMGHRSFLTAVTATFKVVFWGLLLLIIAKVPVLTRWLQQVSPKPGEGDSCPHILQLAQNAARQEWKGSG